MLRNVLLICEASPTFAVLPERWDKDIWIVGVPGGTVDLRTGVLREPRRGDYITKQTAVVPDWKMPKRVFDQFLSEITCGDNDLQHYLQRLAGYALTGSTKEEKLFLIHGPGGNGKTKFVRAIADAAGDYAVEAPHDAFVVKRGERHSTDIAGLDGARLVTASEADDGRHWDESLIKQLTGGDRITARFMRQDNFTYTPQFKLLSVGNHAPELTNVDAATRRRFVSIPFTYQPEAPDDRLAEKLREEYPAILAWMIDGAQDWYAEGLGLLPTAVLEETNQYFDDQNHVQDFLGECCEIMPDWIETSSDINTCWVMWAHQNGIPIRTKTWLMQTLRRLGYAPQRTSRGRGLRGLKLKPIRETL